MNVNFGIIFMVTLVGVASSAVLALAIYLIDKNADRRDKHH
jgi:hypothetical protein